MSEPLLAVEGLSAAYGRIQAVRDVSLTVQAGEVVTLIGPNGAGKTTLVRGILGVHPASSGRVSLEGRDITSARVVQRVRLGLVLVPEGRGVLPAMTVTENLLMGAFARKDRNAATAELEAVYERFPVLRERATQLGGTLSGGQQQMLAIGQALMARPKVLMLDEPSLGLAPLMAREVFDILRGLAEDGMTILLIEQNARLAFSIASRAYVLRTGSVALTGTTDEVSAHPDVQAAYLGG